MKICCFVHCFFPDHFYGTETYTLELARNLQKLGHEAVVVAGVFAGEPKKESEVSSYTFDGVPVVCIDKNFQPNTRLKDSYYQESMKPLLRTVLKDLKPDIVHVTHLLNHTSALLDVLHEMKIPVVATLTDFFGFCYNNKLEAADESLCPGPNQDRTNCLACYLKAKYDKPGTTKRMEVLAGKYPQIGAQILNTLANAGQLKSQRFMHIIEDLRERPGMLLDKYRQYDAVIAPTKFLQGAYQRNGFTIQSHLINFGTDLALVEPPYKTNIKLPIVFGFIGQIAPHKGTDILIDAFKQLKPGTAKLSIYGPADQVPAYMATLQKSAQGLDISFMDTYPQDKTLDVLGRIDVLVIPSRWYENSPLVLLNALSAHVPVIVSDAEGMTEFVQDGHNGFAAERGSVSALAKVMQRIVDDPSIVEKCSANARYERTTESMTKAALEVYESVLARYAGQNRG